MPTSLSDGRKAGPQHRKGFAAEMSERTGKPKRTINQYLAEPKPEPKPPKLKLVEPVDKNTQAKAARGETLDSALTKMSKTRAKLKPDEVVKEALLHLNATCGKQERKALETTKRLDLDANARSAITDVRGWLSQVKAKCSLYDARALLWEALNALKLVEPDRLDDVDADLLDQIAAEVDRIRKKPIDELEQTDTDLTIPDFLKRTKH